MNTEFPRNPEVEKADSNQAFVDLLNSVGSDEAFADHYLDLTQQLADIEGKISFYVREQQINHMRAQGNDTDNYDELDAIYAQKHELEANLRSNAEYLKYASLNTRMDDLVRLNEQTLAANDPTAELLVGALSGVTGVNDIEQLPPFVDFKQNTHDTWQYIPDQAVQGYLEQLVFVDTSRTYLNGNSVTVKADHNKNISVPLSLFVHAAGFESWKGRPDYNNKSWHSSEYGNGGCKSIDTIKHYAALTTDIPPVTRVNVYTQPNGFIFADNSAGDSHRIGAAFLRGHKEMAAETVNFIRLTENHIR